MVFLGRYTDAAMTSTFLHELGHTLGLKHGGVDDLPYKPNFLSIMNYMFQMAGVKKGGKEQFLYSETSRDDIKPNSLSEQTGL